MWKRKLLNLRTPDQNSDSFIAPAPSAPSGILHARAKKFNLIK